MKDHEYQFYKPVIEERKVDKDEIRHFGILASAEKAIQMTSRR